MHRAHYLDSAVVEIFGETLERTDGTAAEDPGLASLREAAACATATFRLEHHNSCIQSRQRLKFKGRFKKAFVSSTLEGMAL